MSKYPTILIIVGLQMSLDFPRKEISKLSFIWKFVVSRSIYLDSQ